jgi:hypothetical protein
MTSSQVNKNPRFDSSVVFGQLKGQEKVKAEVKVILDGLNIGDTLGDLLPPEVKTIISGLGTALNLLLKSQENLTSVLVDTCKVSSAPKVSVTSVSGKSEVIVKEKVKPAPPKPEVVAARKVRQAIREAERKSLFFNLNMGNVPTMNKETLSRKVTLALSSKASSGEHDYDIKDAEEAIDDILSCSKLEFLGTTSRKFYNKKNPNDERNDTFCTMPVRFEFKDKDTRIEAEKILRKVCKVSCAVPYPKKLRLILDGLIKEGKQKFPNCFIRTKVDVDNLSIDVHAKTGDGWVDLGLKREIPLDICDTVSVSPTVAPSSQPASQSDEVMQIS